jgi:hypothetical protein
MAQRKYPRTGWVQVGKVARLLLDGAPRQLTDGATHYHTRVAVLAGRASSRAQPLSAHTTLPRRLTTTRRICPQWAA